VSVVPSPAERLRALGATATIGTNRFGGQQNAADALLTDAAVSGIQARAGWRPRTHAGRLPRCPDEDRPLAPPAARATLLRLLAEPDPALLEEWAALALSHDVRVDAATVPLVLEWWVRQTRRSETIFAVLGQHGRWLASLNPDWRKPVATADVPDDADDSWQTGTSAERLALLTSVRRADPARARALVEATWQNDSADDRRQFLDALIEQRSMEDEPFLEIALDDRSKTVRRRAAGVLALIPGSRLRQRVSDVAKTIITVETSSRLLGKGVRKIVLAPPESFASQWERDGIEQRPPAGLGERAWWLRQILARADLSVWTSLTGLTPDTVLASLKDDDFAPDAIQALIAAASSAGDTAWSTALVRQLHRATPIDIESISILLGRLSGDPQEPLALETASQPTLTTVERWAVLTSFENAWSPAFSAQAMRVVSERASSEPKDIWRLSRAVELASRRISPDAADAFAEAVTASFNATPPDGAIRSTERVRLRADMHREFTAS
jgi:hypothetical protein